jgi:hypothetical protein
MSLHASIQPFHMKPQSHKNQVIKNDFTKKFFPDNQNLLVASTFQRPRWSSNFFLFTVPLMRFTADSTTLPRRLDVLPVMENDESEEDKIIKHIIYIQNS